LEQIQVKIEKFQECGTIFKKKNPKNSRTK